jgi:hypothetical protein
MSAKVQECANCGKKSIKTLPDKDGRQYCGYSCFFEHADKLVQSKSKGGNKKCQR